MYNMGVYNSSCGGKANDAISGNKAISERYLEDLRIICKNNTGPKVVDPSMNEITITTENTDSVVFSVIKKIKQRADFGREKYGTTLDRNDLNISNWITHAQEELMDATLYLEKLKQMYNDDIPSSPSTTGAIDISSEIETKHPRKYKPMFSRNDFLEKNDINDNSNILDDINCSVHGEHISHKKEFSSIHSEPIFSRDNSQKIIREEIDNSTIDLIVYED